jgi:hypothetical protein
LTPTSAAALLGLVLLGAAHDALAARWTRATAAERRGEAAALSGVLTAFGYVAWWLMESLLPAGGMVPGILAYSVGAALGAWVSLNPKAPACSCCSR